MTDIIVSRSSSKMSIVDSVLSVKAFFEASVPPQRGVCTTVPITSQEDVSLSREKANIRDLVSGISMKWGFQVSVRESYALLANCNSLLPLTSLNAYCC